MATTTLEGTNVFARQQELADQADRNALILGAVNTAVTGIATAVQLIATQGVKMDTEALLQIQALLEANNVEIQKIVGKRTIRG